METRSETPEKQTASLGSPLMACWASLPDIEDMMVKQLGWLQSEENSYRQKRAKTLREIGGQMRGFRKMSRMSLRELSRRIGCSAPFLSDMELGRRIYSIEWVRKTLRSLHNA